MAEWSKAGDCKSLPSGTEVRILLCPPQLQIMEILQAAIGILAYLFIGVIITAGACCVVNSSPRKEGEAETAAFVIFWPLFLLFGIIWLFGVTMMWCVNGLYTLCQRTKQAWRDKTQED